MAAPPGPLTASDSLSSGGDDGDMERDDAEPGLPSASPAASAPPAVAPAPAAAAGANDDDVAVVLADLGRDGLPACVARDPAGHTLSLDDLGAVDDVDLLDGSQSPLVAAAGAAPDAASPAGGGGVPVAAMAHYASHFLPHQPAVTPGPAPLQATVRNRGLWAYPDEHAVDNAVDDVTRPGAPGGHGARTPPPPVVWRAPGAGWRSPPRHPGAAAPPAPRWGDRDLVVRLPPPLAADLGGGRGGSAAPFSPRPPPPPPPLPPPTRGRAGLVNMFNTCYMNATLQCLARAPRVVAPFLDGAVLADVNPANPLGHGGRLARAFAGLAQKMWAAGVKTVTPAAFRGALVAAAPQFAGAMQHDAQELLATLLDGLHEDLNRVKTKPYHELRDSAGRPDADVAAEAWHAHAARNDSAVVDACQGLLRSALACPACGHVSVAFDPYMFLSLPLPPPERARLHVVVLAADGTAPPTRVAVDVRGAEPAAGDVTRALRAALRVPPTAGVVLAVLQGGAPPDILWQDDDALPVDPTTEYIAYTWRDGADRVACVARGAARAPRPVVVMVAHDEAPPRRPGATFDPLPPVQLPLLLLVEADTWSGVWPAWGGPQEDVAALGVDPPTGWLWPANLAFVDPAGPIGVTLEAALSPLRAAAAATLQRAEAATAARTAVAGAKTAAAAAVPADTPPAGAASAGTPPAILESGAVGVKAEPPSPAVGGGAPSGAAASLPPPVVVAGRTIPSAPQRNLLLLPGPQAAPTMPPPVVLEGADSLSPRGGGAAAAAATTRGAHDSDLLQAAASDAPRTTPARSKSAAATLATLTCGDGPAADAPPALQPWMVIKAAPGAGGAASPSSSDDDALAPPAATATADPPSAPVAFAVQRTSAPRAVGAVAPAVSAAFGGATGLPSPQAAVVGAQRPPSQAPGFVGPAPSPPAPPQEGVGPALPLPRPATAPPPTGGSRPGVPLSGGRAVYAIETDAFGRPLSIVTPHQWENTLKAPRRDKPGVVMLWLDGPPSMVAPVGGLATVARHPSMDTPPPAPVTLDDCLRAFTARETMGAGDEWRCGGCRRKVAASKELSLWSAPDVVVIHLKRFAFDGLGAKLTADVDYPVKGLDLEPYLPRDAVLDAGAAGGNGSDGAGDRSDSVGSPSAADLSPTSSGATASPAAPRTIGGVPYPRPPGSHVYDLFASVLHWGSTGGGHYTSVALAPPAAAAPGAPLEWCEFDDSTVRTVPPSAARSAAAYVLFYKRRGATDPPIPPPVPVADDDVGDDLGRPRCGWQGGGGVLGGGGHGRRSQPEWRNESNPLAAQLRDVMGESRDKWVTSKHGVDPNRPHRAAPGDRRGGQPDSSDDRRGKRARAGPRSHKQANPRRRRDSDVAEFYGVPSSRSGDDGAAAGDSEEDARATERAIGGVGGDTRFVAYGGARGAAAHLRVYDEADYEDGHSGDRRCHRRDVGGRPTRVARAVETDSDTDDEVRSSSSSSPRGVRNVSQESYPADDPSRSTDVDRTTDDEDDAAHAGYGDDPHGADFVGGRDDDGFDPVQSMGWDCGEV